MGWTAPTANPSPMGNLIPQGYCSCSTRFQNRTPAVVLWGFFRFCESLAPAPPQSPSSFYGSTLQIDFKQSCISKFSIASLQLLPDFRIDDRFRSDETEFVWYRLTVNAQL
ncbi:hypothetical protein AVEN_103698-1 [Araneus ventricosus]|uniref:Uncharacterized protein n=1 Tax=Araneus ventricosus TaxID=182803 RepID=A0A4Y2TTN4_ARAVE|nr:hypothetical protein AVEN_101574-1 [Araneus ventricosus]GBO03976.1 hypothetical protein AVEN_103698-1 [Araneus ventricosus]